MSPGFDWIRKLLWNTQWKGDRLKVIATKLIGEVTQLKRKGSRMASTMLKDMVYKMDSNVKCSSLLRQQSFLKKLSEDLPRGEKKVGAILDAIRNTLTRAENVSIHVACNLEKVEKRAGSLEQFGEMLGACFDFGQSGETVRRYQLLFITKSRRKNTASR